MAILEVVQKGQATRLFKFDCALVSIGFSPQAVLSLEPFSEDAPLLNLDIRADGSCIATPAHNPDSFNINGTPCSKEIPIHAGDTIVTGDYRITIKNLAPGTPHPPTPGLKQAPGPSAEADNARKQKGKGSGSSKAKTSFLYLFFAPVQEYLQDDDVSEILINGPNQIYIERKGKLTPTPAQFINEQALQAAVMNVARSVGRFFNADNPQLDARLPDGSRLHAVMPPLSRAGTVVAIRKFRREKLTLEKLLEFGSITPDGAKLLDEVVKSGKNIIVSGATSSGKTSVLNVLSALIPDNQRILVLEDASELQLQQTHVACFETRKPDEHNKGEITIRDLLKSVLRLRPDRIIVGEIRGGEALDMLQAMNTGHEGCMSTIHANSARDSLSRLETCSLLSGVEIPLAVIREQVASAIDIVVQTARLQDGTRKITSITRVLGLEQGQYKLEDIYSLPGVRAGK